jgi:hypothetical protein
MSEIQKQEDLPAESQSGLWLGQVLVRSHEEEKEEQPGNAQAEFGLTVL